MDYDSGSVSHPSKLLLIIVSHHSHRNPTYDKSLAFSPTVEVDTSRLESLSEQRLTLQSHDRGQNNLRQAEDLTWPGGLPMETDSLVWKMGGGEGRSLASG